MEYELQMRQVGEMVGNPPWENLIAAVQEAIQDPRRLRELENKVNCLTAEVGGGTTRALETSDRGHHHDAKGE